MDDGMVQPGSPLRVRRRPVGALLFVLLGMLLLLFGITDVPRGPDFDHYLAMVRALEAGRGLFLVEQFEALEQPVIITPTGFAVELRNVGTALFWLPWHRLGNLLQQWPAFVGAHNAEIFWLNWVNWLYGVLGIGLTALTLRRITPRGPAIAAIGLLLVGIPAGGAGHCGTRELYCLFWLV
jgi:hypothetical protein